MRLNRFAEAQSAAKHTNKKTAEDRAMTHWVISYSIDQGTSTLDVEQADQPTHEEAVDYVLAWAKQNLEKGEFGDPQEPANEPPMQLLKHYGITITGIIAKE
jgi:hypothetical protein